MAVPGAVLVLLPKSEGAVEVAPAVPNKLPAVEVCGAAAPNKDGVAVVVVDVDAVKLPNKDGALLVCGCCVAGVVVNAPPPNSPPPPAPPKRLVDG